LREIARVTGGKFFEARSAQAVESAYRNLGSVIAREPGRKDVPNEFLALAAILLVAAGGLSAFFSPRLL
jgi:Ca-activated chloride channel family protein